MPTLNAIPPPIPAGKTERIVTANRDQEQYGRGGGRQAFDAMRKRMEITMERDELSVIRRPVHRAFTWCAQCEERVQMITPDEAVAVAGRSAREIYRWVEAGRVHFWETPQGLLSICLRSLY